MPFLDNNSNHGIWVLAPYKVGIIHMSTKYSEVDGSQSMSINIFITCKWLSISSVLFYCNIMFMFLQFNFDAMMPLTTEFEFYWTVEVFP